MLILVYDHIIVTFCKFLFFRLIASHIRVIASSFKRKTASTYMKKSEAQLTSAIEVHLLTLKVF